MSKFLVLYQSKYGSTKKYAKWLADELACDMMEIKNADIAQVQQYDTVILGGGIYAGGVAGLSFIKKHYDKLKNVIIFAVGASPYDENVMAELKKRQLKGALAEIPCFYCRGAWDEEVMSLKDRTLCKILQKAVEKKDVDTIEPWAAALLQTVGKKEDWTDKESLTPIIELALG